MAEKERDKYGRQGSGQRDVGPDLFPLNGRSAIITGSAIARDFVAAGASVAMEDRNERATDVLVSVLQSSRGDAPALPMDVGAHATGPVPQMVGRVASRAIYGTLVVRRCLR